MNYVKLNMNFYSYCSFQMFLEDFIYYSLPILFNSKKSSMTEDKKEIFFFLVNIHLYN